MRLTLLLLLPRRDVSISECCFPNNVLARCDDGSRATPCCGYGTCMPGFPPCCDCDMGCRSSESPADCAEDVLGRSKGVLCFIRQEFGGDKVTICPGMIPEPLLHSSEWANVTIEQLWQPSIHFDDNGSTELMLPENQTLDVTYDFGPDRVTITTVGVGLDEDGITRRYALWFSDTGFEWELSDHYFSRSRGRRVEQGRISARFIRLMVRGGPRRPISVWLHGCAVDPDADLQPAAAAMDAFVAWLRQLAVWLGMMLSICCIAASAVVARRCFTFGGHMPLTWWRIAGASVSPRAPLLEPPAVQLAEEESDSDSASGFQPLAAND